MAQIIRHLCMQAKFIEPCSPNFGMLHSGYKVSCTNSPTVTAALLVWEKERDATEHTPASLAPSQTRARGTSLHLQVLRLKA